MESDYKVMTIIVAAATNTPPTISNIANQSTNEDIATSAIAFTVGDLETAAGTLVVSGGSSNTVLVPNANIVLGGSGASRTVTITPASNQNGTSTITVTVSDGVATASDTFVLTVNAVNDSPTISNIANQSTNQNTATSALAFTVGDLETAAGTLVVSGASSNTVLVPNANIVLGGSGAARTVTITPASNQNGTSTITVTVSDGVATASDTFVLTVTSTTVTTYTITASAGANGSISPSGVVTVNSGSSQTFAIAAGTGYHVASVVVDGVSAGAVTSYTFTNVTADHTISATFIANTATTAYTITASAGANGSITPSGVVTVNSGARKTFTFSANRGYHIARILVDGRSVSVRSSYTFWNVKANHTISVTFAPNRWWDNDDDEHDDDEHDD
jgi:hypothetical protein